MKNNKSSAPQDERFLTRRIGGTVYKIAVHFNNKSKEDFNSKVCRLIKQDIVRSAFSTEKINFYSKDD